MVMRMDSVAYPFWMFRAPHPSQGNIVHLLETINSSPVDATEALKPYFIRREELSVHAGCLLCEACVIVPPKGEKRC